MNFPSHVLAYDCETTGLISAYDFVTSLSVVEFIDGEVTGQMFERKVRPTAKLKLSLEAMQVQGLNLESDDLDTEEFVQQMASHLGKIFPKDSIPAKQTVLELRDWSSQLKLQTVPVVAHMASFDHGFYDQKINNTVIKDYFGDALSPTWICTKSIACHLWPDKAKKDLNSCPLALGIEPRKANGHESLEDAIKCGQAYFAMKKIWEERHGG